MCRELGIAIVSYSPLGRGFFAGYKPEDAKSENDFRKVWRKFALSLLVGVTKLATVAWNLASGWNVQFAPTYDYFLSYCASLFSLTTAYCASHITTARYIGRVVEPMGWLFASIP